jgi:hypothetical protein
MPDAWVWLGDLAYMDIPAVDCYNEANKDHPDCNCTATLLRHPSHGCKSGDEQNARRKADAIVRSSGLFSANCFPILGVVVIFTCMQMTSANRTILTFPTCSDVGVVHV